jgi:hypothetical protein
MPLQTADEMRNKIDAARFDTVSDGSNVRADVLGFLKSHGILIEDSQVLLKASEIRHDASSIHKCPWNTCQNTKH